MDGRTSINVKTLLDCQLYTFVDTAYLRGRSVQDVVRALCDGGSDVIQLRAKTATLEEIRRIAEIMAPITRGAGIPLVINDYPMIAGEVGAEMVHLGQEDFFDQGYSRRDNVPGLLPGTLLGLSSHAPNQAQRAVEAGADYVAVGPVYATGTKPGRKPVTLDYVRWAATNLRIPWFAIGGINLTNLDEVLDAGATRICVVSGILDTPDISRACRQFRQRLG